MFTHTSRGDIFQTTVPRGMISFSVAAVCSIFALVRRRRAPRGESRGTTLTSKLYALELSRARDCPAIRRENGKKDDRRES